MRHIVHPYKKGYTMKKMFLICLCSVLFNSTHAVHILSGFISYTHIGVSNAYEIKLTLYKDCVSAPAANTDTVCLSSPVCSYSTYIVLSNHTVAQVQNCFGIAGLTICQGGTLFGVEKHTYTGIFTLPFNCPDWEFTYVMDEGITTAPLHGIVLRTTLDNSQFTHNNSAGIAADPCIVACLGTNLCMPLAATDADNDSLIYEFTLADTSYTEQCPAVYAVAQTLPLPYNYFNASWGTINPATGLFCFNIPFIANAMVTYKITETSNGIVKAMHKGFFLLGTDATLSCITPIHNFQLHSKKIKCAYSNNTIKVFNLNNAIEPPVILIYDAQGKQILKHTITQHEINDEPVEINGVRFSKGVYNCLVKDISGNSVPGKLVVAE